MQILIYATIIQIVCKITQSYTALLYNLYSTLYSTSNNSLNTKDFLSALNLLVHVLANQQLVNLFTDNHYYQYTNISANTMQY